MLFNEALQKFTTWKSLDVKKGTIKGYDLILRQFCVFVRNCHIEEVKLDDVVMWFNLMRGLEWDHNSFIPKAMALRKFLEFFTLQKYRVLNPELIPVPKKEFKFPRVANELQYEKLLSVIPEKTNQPRHIRNRALINMFWDTGARNGEILSLNETDLDLENMWAFIKTEKSQGKFPARKIRWTKKTNDTLKAWIKKRDHLKTIVTFTDKEALFVSVVNKQVGKRLTIKGLGEMMRRYSNLAGLPYVNVHSMRHHMGHDLAKKKYNNSVISGMLGHSSLASSFVYTRLNDTELDEIYQEYKGVPVPSLSPQSA